MISLNSFIIANRASLDTIQVTPDFKEEDYLNSHIDNSIFEWPSTSLFYDYTSILSLGLGISENKADCNLTVVGYSNVNKISAYIYLQRYASGKWSTIFGGSFRSDKNPSALSYVASKQLDTAGSYRFTAQIFVYTKDKTA